MLVAGQDTRQISVARAARHVVHLRGGEFALDSSWSALTPMAQRLVTAEVGLPLGLHLALELAEQ